MTRTLKTLFPAAAALAMIVAIPTAGNANTFEARFDYDSAAPASVTLEIFDAKAKEICDAEMRRAGFRPTEGRFERRKCQDDLIKRAVKQSKSRALIASFAARSVNTIYKPKPSTLALLKTKRSDVVKVASHK